MPIRALLWSLLWALAMSVVAPARGATVALLEVYDSRGRRLEFEPDGRFGHCAIRVGHHWLHAHPRIDVELTDDLSSYGRNPEVWTNPHVADPSPEQVRFYLGQTFNHDLEWTFTNDDTTYCSRLVGEILNLEPRPAFFMGSAFRRHVPRYGEVGLSPDDIEKAIRRMGFTKIPATIGCERAMLN